jgi:HAD superfamily hydrolase (TIGR01484 family)
MVASPKPRWLLASDLDGTLIPAAGSPPSGSPAFRIAMAATPGCVLAYVTGRHLALALAGIRESALPVPSFLVGDVGTSVHEHRDGAWALDEGYRARMREAMGGGRAEDLAPRLDGLGLRLQEPERQAEFKRSYTFGPGRSEAEVETLVRERLEGLPVRSVLSREPTSGLGLLDLLPAGVAKDTAVRHLRDRLRLTDDRVLFAGDSGNDRDALLGGWRAVLVGNAPAGLREELAAEAERRGLGPRLHMASASLADGVLEACERFGLLEADA